MSIFLIILKTLDIVFTVLLAVAGGAAYIDPNDYSPPNQQHLQLFKEYAFSIILFSAVMVGISKACSLLLSKKIDSLKQINATLETLSEVFFSDIERTEQFKNRVTLFKATKGFFYQKNRLKIFSRSGDNYQGSQTFFLIDNDQEDGNEGVAGRAWFSNSTVSVEFPEWSESGTSKTARGYREKYAKDGWLSMEKASSLNIKSRSITATVVRNQKGSRWGVLVLDSRDPNGIPNNPEKNNLIDMVARILSFGVS